MTVHSCELQFPGFDAAGERGAIRWELFLHREVRDVLLTPRADTLRVLHEGPVDREGWCTTLRVGGFPVPQVGADRDVVAGEDQVDVAA